MSQLECWFRILEIISRRGLWDRATIHCTACYISQGCCRSVKHRHPSAAVFVPCCIPSCIASSFSMNPNEMWWDKFVDKWTNMLSFVGSWLNVDNYKHTSRVKYDFVFLDSPKWQPQALSEIDFGLSFKFVLLLISIKTYDKSVSDVNLFTVRGFAKCALALLSRMPILGLVIFIFLSDWNTSIDDSVMAIWFKEAALTQLFQCRYLQRFTGTPGFLQTTPRCQSTLLMSYRVVNVLVDVTSLSWVQFDNRSTCLNDHDRTSLLHVENLQQHFIIGSSDYNHYGQKTWPLCLNRATRSQKYTEHCYPFP